MRKFFVTLILSALTLPISVTAIAEDPSQALPEGSPIAQDGSPRPWDTPDMSDPEVILSGPGAESHPAAIAIRDSLQSYLKDKDARFGIGILIEGNDTISVNGHKPFPMASVYKFPQALALAEYCHNRDIVFSDTVEIPAYQLRENTWSPMRERYGVRDIKLPISEILAYSLQQSDNNACDILFTILGGPETVNDFMKRKGYRDIRVENTEYQLQNHPTWGYSNTATPIGMAVLLDDFDTRHCLASAEMAEVARLMESCETGRDRLVAGLSKDAVCGHKTGTGPELPNGRLMTINDCGYVRRIDGRRYAIAVFIAESGYDIDSTSAMIADISHIVRTLLKRYATD